MTLPTYREGPADPNPQLSAFESNAPNYPYPLRTNFTKDQQPKAWRTLNLENEYLFCRVLPDLGGHLYSCRDKRNGREMFYANPVIKRASVGLRGSWAAMGIESSFPAGHSRVSASPVDFALRTDEDGSARAIVEDVDLVTGTEWRVEFILRPGIAILEQRVTLYNPMATRRPYLWWANAGIELDDPATRFIIPTQFAATHGIGEIETWPVTSQGRNESLVAGHADASAWFAYKCREPFFAVYKPASRTGVVHFADPAVLAGKKVWIWGAKQDEYVRKELTDNFPSYVEIQAGVFQDQETFGFLGPEQFKAFSEYWIPVRDEGGVSRANRDAIVNLERRGAASNASLAVELGVTHVLEGGVLRMRNSGHVVYEEKVTLTPAATYTHILENAVASAYTVQLLDSTGALVIEYSEGRYDGADPREVKLGKQSQTDWNSGSSPAFLLARGAYNELQSHDSFALSDYHAGLRADPSNVDLQKAAGRMALVLNRFDEAAKLLEQALTAQPSDQETAYLLGTTQAMLGRNFLARQTLSGVHPDSPFSASTALQLALLAARTKDYAGALLALKPLLAIRSGPVRAGAIEVAVLRHAGRRQEAEKEMTAWREIDPADSMLRFEATELGHEDEVLWMHLGADTERVLQLVDEYLGLGMEDDAIILLSHSYPLVAADDVEPGAVVPARSPLIAYYRAYCQRRLGQDPTASFRAAADDSLTYSFPSRARSEQVLSTAIEVNPSDAHAYFLRGLLRINELRIDEAIADWQKTRSFSPRIPELYLELSKALTELKKDPSAAAAVVKAGLALDPESPDLRSALDRTAASVTPAASATVPSGSSSPSEVATAALLRAASGRGAEALGLFDPKVFSAEKQPDDIRRAYIEVQLQRLVSDARAGRCPASVDAMDHLGGEDPNLTFTMYGFNAFMKPAHFLYYSAEIESACHEDKSARKHWTKISKMDEPLPSPEFVFPLLAALRVNPEGAKPRIAAALTSVRAAATNSGAPNKVAILYAEAVLLHASGMDDQAIRQLQELAKSRQDSWIAYLAILELNEVMNAMKATR